MGSQHVQPVRQRLRPQGRGARAAEGAQAGRGAPLPERGWAGWPTCSGAGAPARATSSRACRCAAPSTPSSSSSRWSAVAAARRACCGLAYGEAAAVPAAGRRWRCCSSSVYLLSLRGLLQAASGVAHTMALKGTLKDFGIADILQLIGQQQKTGHAAPQVQGPGGRHRLQGRQHRPGRERHPQEEGPDRHHAGARRAHHRGPAGGRAGDAAAHPQAAGRRAGRPASAITAERFKQMVQLQATETLYRLFTWKTGHLRVRAEPTSSPTPTRSPRCAPSRC